MPTADKPPKPRVVVIPDSTFAKVEWPIVQTAFSYKVRYAFAESYLPMGSQLNGDINELVTTSNEVLLTSLAPETNYTVFVSSLRSSQNSNETIVHFRTLQLIRQPNLGSGDVLYAPPTPETYTHALKTTDLGYEFDTEKTGLFIHDDFYQFATFAITIHDPRTHIDLQITGSSGTWLQQVPTTAWLHKTVLLLGIRVTSTTSVQWLDANRLRAPGVIDNGNGARAFERELSTSPPTFRASLTSLQRPFSGTLYVKIGICNSNRSFCGVQLV